LTYQNAGSFSRDPAGTQIDEVNAMKKKILFFCVLLILMVVITFRYVRLSDVGEFYLKVFKKDGGIARRNGHGLLDGEAILYKHGHIESKANFINGQKNGWRVYYYETGIIKNKTFFKNDTAQVISYQYYENGKLNYKTNVRNAKRYGSLYWYLENGKLDFYAVSDINGESFCLFEYDQSEKLIKMTGPIISYNIYSLDEKNDSTIVLESYYSHHYDNRYANIKDLYITVATPPALNMKVNININNIQYNNLLIQNNCIKVPNVFMNKGAYDIFIQGSLTDKFGKKINAMKMKTRIYKE
jgi:hypothetical protein